jgi:predicted RNase H-like nuclease (RuvC/YqgF family)
MRKFLISATLLASTLAIAAPAAAQHAMPRGNAYGYNHNGGSVRDLMVRVNRIEQQINQLDRRRILSNREGDRLRREANALERRLAQASRNGLNRNETREIQIRIAQLEQNVQRQATDGNRGRR